MKKEMLINVLQPEECRIAIVEDGVLEELYVERTSHESYTGNIYKGKIVNLEPAIQAAFVDFSVGRNGFLHVSDVEPQYFHRHGAGDVEPESRPRGREREPQRDRDRGKKPPPRRDRGRVREERRPGFPPEPGDVPPPYPSTAGSNRGTAQARSPSRRTRPPGTAAACPVGIGNRRAIGGGSANAPISRSEVVAIVRNRHAGSGKDSSSRHERRPWSRPPRAGGAPPPEPASPRACAKRNILTGAPEPPRGRRPARGGRSAAWDPEIGWGRDIEPERTTGAPPSRAGVRGPTSRRSRRSIRRSDQDPVFDPDLPPSRTHRSRPMTRPAEGPSEPEGPQNTPDTESRPPSRPSECPRSGRTRGSPNRRSNRSEAGSHRKKGRGDEAERRQPSGSRTAEPRRPVGGESLSSRAIEPEPGRRKLPRP